MYKLKRLSSEALPAALKRAEHYRLLNEPAQAESICRDVLEQDPDDQHALVTLLLALTDQFGQQPEERAREARDLVSRLRGEYDRAYYNGIICERHARALLRRGAPGNGAVVYDWLHQALEWFEQAEQLRPEGNEDALLRWNACVRTLARYPNARPAAAEEFRPFLE
ncbi:MAG TPA: hypothetical protein VJS92_12335 [Candidatus Polarisedimenticolaceae bacterium]|nr:hypothetical protein [Candidatus Polarisedimenticolaceae bacterium]